MIFSSRRGVILIGIDYDFLFEAHAVGKSFTITIPRRAANPEVDITKLGPRQWFLLLHVTQLYNVHVKVEFFLLLHVTQLYNVHVKVEFLVFKFR